MASRDLQSALEATLESPIAELSMIGGGDINDAYRVRLSDGRRRFVKTHPHAPPGMYSAEADGLAWLSQSQGLPVPEVVAVAEAAPPAPAFLVLSYVDSGTPARDYAERLGRGLAAVHRAGTPQFGLERDNFIGTLPQANTPCDSWPEFYAERRLLPQLELAARAGRAPQRLRAGLERVCAALSSLVGDPEPPARLHGDLWGGNVMRDAGGAPCLIDPAVYGGHREVDLAMMRLFGGFAERTFAAYAEAFPLSPGADERVALYQLYPLMVHVNLFGGHYVDQVQRIVARF